MLAFVLMIGLIIFLLAAFLWRCGWAEKGDKRLITSVAIMMRPTLMANLLISVESVEERILEVCYFVLTHFVTSPSRALRTPGFLPRIWGAERYRRRPFPYGSAIAVGPFIVHQKG